MAQVTSPMGDAEKMTRMQMRVSGILECFDLYGMGVFIPGAVEEIRDVVEKLFVKNERV